LNTIDDVFGVSDRSPSILASMMRIESDEKYDESQLVDHSELAASNRLEEYLKLRLSREDSRSKSVDRSFDIQFLLHVQ